MINCPACGSENCQKFSVIHSQGTSSGTSTITDANAPFNPSHYGKSSNQTNAAKMAAPPRKPYPMIILAIAAYFGWGVWGEINFGTMFDTVGLIISLGFYFLSLKRKSEYPEKYQQWADSWLCNKCGGSFVHAL